MMYNVCVVYADVYGEHQDMFEVETDKEQKAIKAVKELIESEGGKVTVIKTVR